MSETVINASELPKKFNHTGDLRVEGNIPSGTVLEIKDGKLFVNGSVEDDVQIKQRQNSSVVIGATSSFSIGSWYRYTKQEQSSITPQGMIEITGDVGKRAIVDSNNVVKINGNVDDHSQVIGIGGISAGSARGENIFFDSGSNVQVNGEVGDKARLSALNDIRVGSNVGNEQNYQAGNKITIEGGVGNKAQIKAADRIEISGKVGDNPRMKAGDKVIINGEKVSSNPIDKEILVASAAGLLRSGVDQPIHVGGNTGSGSIPRNSGQIQIT